MRNPTANSAAQAAITTKMKTKNRLRSCCCASWRILRCGVVRIVTQSSARITTATAFQPAIAALANRSSPRKATNVAAPTANPRTRRWRASGRQTRSTIRIYGVELLTFRQQWQVAIRKRHFGPRGLAFLDSEADVTPAAPFVMRSSLRIAAASLFFVRVRFGDELRERSVHLDIV